MNDFTLDNVNEMYIDVLREIGNIGAGNATTSLASMINEQIDMNVPKVELMEASKAEFRNLSGRRDYCSEFFWK